MKAKKKKKKKIKINNAFQKRLDKPDHKPSKIWVDEGSAFYNISKKSWLQDNDIETKSTHNQRKSVVAKRFISILKKTSYKYVNSVSNMSI